MYAKSQRRKGLYKALSRTQVVYAKTSLHQKNQVIRNSSLIEHMLANLDMLSTGRCRRVEVRILDAILRLKSATALKNYSSGVWYRASKRSIKGNAELGSAAIEWIQPRCAFRMNTDVPKLARSSMEWEFVDLTVRCG